MKHTWDASYLKSAKRAFLELELIGLKNASLKVELLTVAHIRSEDGFLKDQEDTSKGFRAKKKPVIEEPTTTTRRWVGVLKNDLNLY